MNMALEILQSPFSLSGIYMFDARYFLLTGLWENIWKTFSGDAYDGLEL